MKTFLALLVGLWISSTSYGLVTAYVSFEHPEGWKCELSQGVWICQSSLESERKESVVLSIATVATEWDTLANYEEYLKQPRKVQDEDGKVLQSKVVYVRTRNINGTNWVDSLQQNSELPGFWSRYLATIQNKLAILITYIVSDEKYKQMAPQFDRMVATLKPNAEFDLNVASKQGDGPLPGSTKLGPLQKNILAERLNTKKKTDKVEEVVSEETPYAQYLLMGGVVAIVLLVLRSRRKKKAVRREPGLPVEPPQRKAK